MVGVRMMYSLLDQPVSVVDAPGAKDLQVEGGTIALDNVTFSYGGGKGVLKNLSVIFPAGKMTAIISPSGGGKSTLVNLLLRLYDPDSGTVSIDGQDIKQAKIASVRKNIAFVGQDTFLFSASVMDNIRMARPDASDEDVMNAAKIAPDIARPLFEAFVRQLENDLGRHVPTGVFGADMKVHLVNIRR